MKNLTNELFWHLSSEDESDESIFFIDKKIIQIFSNK